MKQKSIMRSKNILLYLVTILVVLSVSTAVVFADGGYVDGHLFLSNVRAVQAYGTMQPVDMGTQQNQVWTNIQIYYDYYHFVEFGIIRIGKGMSVSQYYYAAWGDGSARHTWNIGTINNNQHNFRIESNNGYDWYFYLDGSQVFYAYCPMVSYSISAMTEINYALGSSSGTLVSNWQALQYKISGGSWTYWTSIIPADVSPYLTVSKNEITHSVNSYVQ